MPVIRLDNVTVFYSKKEASRASKGLFSPMARMGNFFGDRGLKYAQEMRNKPEYTGRAEALDALSLTVFNGETLSVIGPSGCGKTTLLKVVAGLIVPDDGAVYFDGVPLKDIPTAERGIGMVFQNYALYPHRTAHDNIGFFDIVHNQEEKIPDRLKEISEVMNVSLKHILQKRPPKLSGGEQQRVAVARCLARDPNVFLFDEPLSNLDARLRSEIRLRIRRMLNHYKITTLYVTHDQQEAIAFGDRIAVMNEGKILQIGTYHELYHTPRERFVAEFFGNPAMNLFEGRIVGDIFRTDYFTLGPIPLENDQEGRADMGIHAEHVQVVEADEDAIPARVIHMELLFSEQEQVLYMDIHGMQCAARVPMRSGIQKGDRVHLKFPLDHMHFFDAETGRHLY